MYIYNIMKIIDSHYIILIVLFLILFLIYKYMYNNPQVKNLDKYLLDVVKDQKDIVLSCKPKIWIHLDREINSREWESFNSKNSKKLNQPYLYLTIETILNHCSETFDIYLITDDSFSEIIDDWKIDMSKISYPIKDKIRMKGLMQILHQYGGMVLPPNFICKENLIEMYKKYIEDGIFVSELPIFKNNTIEYCASNKIMGSKKDNNVLKKYILWFENVISNDYTSESIFKDEDREWLTKNVENKNIKMIPGKNIGVIDNDDKNISLERLMSTELISFHNKSYGIYIPRVELLNRKHYNWFVQLHEEEVLHCKNNISYLLQ